MCSASSKEVPSSGLIANAFWMDGGNAIVTPIPPVSKAVFFKKSLLVSIYCYFGLEKSRGQGCSYNDSHQTPGLFFFLLFQNPHQFIDIIVAVILTVYGLIHILAVVIQLLLRIHPAYG